MTLLLIGGSGFLSGTIARAAVAAGHEVAAITRGSREVPQGVRPYTADRHDANAFGKAVDAALASFGGTADLAVDVIPFSREDAEQDVAVLSGRVRSFVFVSTDFVYDPALRKFPQREDDAAYLTDGYGGKKRAGEEVLLAAGTAQLAWTVLRPGHIYGPGSKLGCLPPLGRDEQLIERLRRKERIPLLCGGHFLQQPIFVEDLAAVILGVADHPAAAGQICNVAGPDVVESVTYYRIVAEVLGVELMVEDVSADAYLRENPDRASFVCHRLYDLSRLAHTSIPLPATSLRAGLERHVRSLAD